MESLEVPTPRVAVGIKCVNLFKIVSKGHVVSTRIIDYYHHLDKLFIFSFHVLICNMD